METRRYINVRTWSENWFETLSASEKLVWIYLNTNSSTNMLGVYSMTVRRIAYECHISEPAARRNIKKLEDIKKLIYSDGYIILIDWMAQQAMNPSMRIAAQKEYDKLPEEICAQLSEQTHQSIKSIRQDTKQAVPSLPVPDCHIPQEKEEEDENPEKEHEKKALEQEREGVEQKPKMTGQEPNMTEQEPPTSGQKQEPDLPLPLQETLQRAILNKSWLKTLCHNHRLKETEIKEWLEHFCRKLQNEGTERKSVRDFRQHFASWLDIQLNHSNYTKTYRHDNTTSHSAHTESAIFNGKLPSDIDSVLQSQALQRIEQLRIEGVLPKVSEP